jgi:hypothetical protein
MTLKPYDDNNINKTKKPLFRELTCDFVPKYRVNNDMLAYIGFGNIILKQQKPSLT